MLYEITRFVVGTKMFQFFTTMRYARPRVAKSSYVASTISLATSTGECEVYACQICCNNNNNNNNDSFIRVDYPE